MKTETLKGTTIAVTFAVIGVFAASLYDEHSENAKGKRSSTTARSALSSIPAAAAGNVELESKATTLAAFNAAATVPDEDNLCPRYWGGPCTRIAHYGIPCTDPRLREWLAPIATWEIYCMEGGKERRMTSGESSVARLTPVSDGTFDIGWTSRGIAPLVGRDSPRELRVIVAGVDIGPPSPRTLTTLWRELSKGADESAPVFCDALPLEDPQLGKCGWYRADAKDFYRLRSPIVNTATGKASWLESVENGQFYFTYNHNITHVQPLECIDPRVSNAVNVEGQHNVYCVAGGKLVRKAPADDASMTPMDLFVRHDQLRQYGATEEEGR